MAQKETGEPRIDQFAQTEWSLIFQADRSDAAAELAHLLACLAL